MSLSRFFWACAILLVLGAFGTIGWVVLNDNVGSVSRIIDETPQPRLPTGTLMVNSQTVTVELARSPEEQRQGLSFRPPLAADEGMLFVYPVAQPQTFWMFGMTFPLDIVFLNDHRVVSVASNVPPPVGLAPPVTVASPADADMVLELLAGTAERAGIVEGTFVTVRIP